MYKTVPLLEYKWIGFYICCRALHIVKSTSPVYNRIKSKCIIDIKSFTCLVLKITYQGDRAAEIVVLCLWSNLGCCVDIVSSDVYVLGGMLNITYGTGFNMDTLKSGIQRNFLDDKVSAFPLMQFSILGDAFA